MHIPHYHHDAIYLGMLTCLLTRSAHALYMVHYLAIHRL